MRQRLTVTGGSAGGYCPCERGNCSITGCQTVGNLFYIGGSEADNWAVKGVAEAYGKYGRHIITSRIEHHAVLNSCHYLEEQGYEVTYLDVDQNGMISLEQLEHAVRRIRS